MPDPNPTTQNNTPTGPKYQIVMELGRGGMGVVYLAMSRGPQGFLKLFVFKMLQKRLVGHPEIHRMFLDEARILSRLAHPNVVQVFEVIEYGGIPTIVMEYLEGQPLSAILGCGDPPLPIPLRVHVITKVLAGLHAAHELCDYDGTPFQLIHRDVSPQNVLVQFDGQVKVLDFGIAKAEGSESDTAIGELKGKIRYMAPEQLLRQGADRRVDVFAVGVMLWESLYGGRYWGELPDGEVVRSLLGKSLPPLPANPAVPERLAAICRRALAPEAQDRYQTAEEFQRDLERYLMDESRDPGAEQVGAFVRAHFAEEREIAKRIVDAHIKAAERALSPTSSSAQTLILPGDVTPSGAQVLAAPRRSRRTLMLAAIGFAALIGVTATAVLLSRGGPRAPVAGGATTANAPPAPGGQSSSGLTCGRGFKACDDQCVSVDRPDFGCADPACRPCRVPNATARCNLRGECDIAVCYQEYDDCDSSSANGCETNVRIDPSHCGGCGRACPELPHATRGCGDVCTIWRCESGYKDCNGIASDGCETSTATDASHCGRCGNVCRSGQRCRHGECG